MRLHLPRPVLFLRLLWSMIVLLGGTRLAVGHPMPNSLVVLDMQPGGVAAELQLPLSELQPAFGQDIVHNPAALVAEFGPALRAYIQQHTRPVSPDGRPWTVRVGGLQVGGAEQTATGPYQELTAQLWLQPPPGASPRTFALHYDVILHQVVTHIALVSVRRDWAAGRVDPAAPTEVGVIRLDVRNNVIPPLLVNQGSGGGGWWAGFQGMVRLGLSHIAEGTDHLLFLLVLLLPAPLLAGAGRWGRAGGVRYSLLQLLKIVTAFTAGHSLTLLAGALGWVQLPAQPVEILIAVSILVSAGHAVRPLFPGREAYVAAGFGLVHGLAFASTLAGLRLAPGPLTLSILGFNLGIELMQLLVIGLTVPWLLLLSRTAYYTVLRVGGAALAALAAIGWLTERVLGQSNLLTSAVGQAAQQAPWLLGLLAVGALLSYWHERNRRVSSTT